ncbi:hypothetical protein JNM87_05405 [Candidatus Saccharibacteria bacterium]|nr:hypothetical protein [Candidatus Saccharibacteria bacterium]
MELTSRIIVERGVPTRMVKAAELGMIATLRQVHPNPAVRVQDVDGYFPMLQGDQVDARVIEGQLAWAGGGVNVWLTARDLGFVRGDGSRVNFLYGLASDGGHLIVSGYRLDKHSPESRTELLTTVVHETGHVLGLVDETASRHSRKYGFSGHCINPCTMEASNGIDDTRRTRDKLLGEIATAGFCNECLQDLAKLGEKLRNM